MLRLAEAKKFLKIAGLCRFFAFSAALELVSGPLRIRKGAPSPAVSDFRLQIAASRVALRSWQYRELRTLE